MKRTAETSINILSLISAIADEDDGKLKLLKKFQYWGILQAEVCCSHPKCNEKMVLCKDTHYNDGYIFICKSPKHIPAGNNNNKITRWQFKRRKSVRSETFFQGSHLSIMQIFLFIKMWLSNTSLKVMSNEFGFSERTAINWNQFCYEVVTQYCVNCSSKIGGNGRTVEVDEAVFGKRKYNRGRLMKSQWVLGGIEGETGNCFLVPIQNRKRETLFEVIQNNINPGTTIMTDCWRAYEGLEELGHYTVNHTNNFVDPNTNAHTQRQEVLWRHVKVTLPNYSRHQNLMVGYLSKFIFTRKMKMQNMNPTFEFMRHATELFKTNSLKAIASYYKIKIVLID